MLQLLKNKLDKVKREIIINSESLETRVAVVEDGQLEEYEVEHPTSERIVGSIFKGRIQNLEDELQAAFVDIGMKKNAFLHYWDMIPDDTARLEEEQGVRSRSSRRKRVNNADIAKRFPVNSEIVVQVSKDRIGTKGPRVTANLSIPGRSLVLMPGSKLRGVSRKIESSEDRARLKKVLARLPVPKDVGLIVRTMGIGVRKTGFVRDLRALIATWEEIQTKIKNEKAPCCVYSEPGLNARIVRDWLTEDVDRIAVDDREAFEAIKAIAAKMSRRIRSRIQMYEGERPIFEHFEVDRQIAEASRRKVTLQSGGHLVFDETEALIAIDVNTGRYKGRGSQEDAILEVNTEAVNEVARQLRLRNVGGLVVVDLIDMKSKKHQTAVYRTMKRALERDRARTNVVQISPLGLMEMTRQRVEESIHSSMFGDCPYCKGRGHVRSSLSMSVEVQRRVAAVLRKKRNISAENARVLVVVHPRVLDRMRKEDEEILMNMQEKFEGHLAFKSDPSRHIEDFEIRDEDSGDLLYQTAGER